MLMSPPTCKSLWFFLIIVGFLGQNLHCVLSSPHRILVDTDVDTDDLFGLLYLLKLNKSEFDLVVRLFFYQSSLCSLNFLFFLLIIALFFVTGDYSKCKCVDERRSRSESSVRLIAHDGSWRCRRRCRRWGCDSWRWYYSLRRRWLFSDYRTGPLLPRLLVNIFCWFFFVLIWFKNVKRVC